MLLAVKGLADQLGHLQLLGSMLVGGKLLGYESSGPECFGNVHKVFWLAGLFDKVLFELAWRPIQPLTIQFKEVNPNDQPGLVRLFL